MKYNSLFTKYYDDIMEDIDYNIWYEFTNSYLKDRINILDIGCGTGTFINAFNGNKYNLFGLDISLEMIMQAKIKSKINHNQINFINQNMLEYKNNDFFDLITCFFDTINYLETENDIINFFDLCKNNLKNNGILIIDFFTKEKYLESKKLIFKKNKNFLKYKWKIKLKKPNILIHKIKINGKKEYYYEYYYDILKLIPNNFKIIKNITIDNERTILALINNK